jgi:hypothetical protein
MSDNLKIFLIRSTVYPGNSFLAVNQLNFDTTNVSLFDEIKKFSVKISLPIYYYTEDGTKITSVDDYGKSLTSINPELLSEILDHTNLSPWDQSIVCLLKSLRGDVGVVLYWY